MPEPEEPDGVAEGRLVGLRAGPDVLHRPAPGADELGEAGVLLVEPGEGLRIGRHARSLRAGSGGAPAGAAGAVDTARPCGPDQFSSAACAARLRRLPSCMAATPATGMGYPPPTRSAGSSWRPGSPPGPRAPPPGPPAPGA